MQNFYARKHTVEKSRSLGGAAGFSGSLSTHGARFGSLWQALSPAASSSSWRQEAGSARMEAVEKSATGTGLHALVYLCSKLPVYGEFRIGFTKWNQR